VRDVGLIAVDDPGLDAAPDPVDDELPGCRAGRKLSRARIEVSERPGEHDLCQHLVVSGEDPERLDRAEKVGVGIIGLRQCCETPAEQPETLEEDLADEAGLVAEELIDGGR
jgi:hypothetical protein